ncbi:hypothetical protein SISNIDRAFT_481282 [Sistotremastrum niveocremeum HHB9708]|uniref:DUF6593 domain-containing protein n=1 Tax=Sistotremastrum niveocremeum HHB9708 TaxID=1314777 RepID=A0A165A6W2_9AGAM|nr:hypothetical protein SISNIDRAFT_481282 [Sistotremastrum niveocremeum HHB9708]
MSRAPSKPSPIFLQLATNSLSNNTIASENDAIYYEVRTQSWDPNMTRLSRRLDSDSRELSLLAEVERKNNSEPRIRCNWVEGFTEFRNSSEWIKIPVSKSLSATFPGVDGKLYRWLVVKGALQLVRDETPETPLVTFHRHHRHMMVFRMSKHASLEVAAECLADLDAIVCECFQALST